MFQTFARKLITNYVLYVDLKILFECFFEAKFNPLSTSAVLNLLSKSID